MKQVLLLIGFLGCVAWASAQNQNASQAVEDLLESVGENMSDDTDIQEILDDWEGFRQRPLNVNKATKGEWLRLHLLSEVQVNNLMAYRSKTGAIYSIYELAAVDGFSPGLLQKIEPFLSFEISDGRPESKRSSTDLFARSTRKFSSSDQTKYEGAPERYYFRMKHVSTRLEYGLVAEKDPGEAFFSQSNKQGFDYTGAFANFGFGRKDNRLFAGDYHVRFGQGLVAWQGFSMGKSAETTQVLRSEEGVRSYLSTDENQFFRGVAAQIKLRNVTFYPFVSAHKIDASIDTIDGQRYFGAFQTSGYHRTGSEIAGENALHQIAGGGHVTYSIGQWSLGATAVYTRFDAFMDRSDEPYNQFLPEGRENVTGGFNWKGALKKVFVFGEAAVSKNAGKALIAGVMTNPTSNSELSLVYRNINKTYFSFFSNAFTESSRVNDERAIYIGAKVLPASRWAVQAYADFFRHQWLKYTTSAPSSGTEFLVQVSYAPSRLTSYYLRFFQEEKGQRLIDGALRYNQQQLINRLRLNFSHDLNDRVSLKSRLEFSFYSKQAGEQGFLVYQDVAYKPLHKPCALNGRLAYFSTDGYNSRLYTYENDLLYSFAVPALYGNGLRAYVNFQHKLNRRITFWLKFAATKQLELEGAEATDNHSIIPELKFQVRCQL